MEKLESLLKDINEKFDAFNLEATKQVEKGNKAAGQRARKLSLELRDLLKKFKALSIKA